MNFRRFLDAAEAFLVEAYMSLPHVSLMDAIENTKEMRIGAKEKRAVPEAPVRGNDQSLTEFNEMVKGLSFS